MIIALATMKDVGPIARNNYDLRMETEKVHMNLEQIAQGVRELVIHPNRGFYLLAKQDEQVVGQVMVTSEWSDWRNRSIWWLHRIYIKKKWRQHGVCTQLFQRLLAEAKKNNVFALRLYLHKENKQAESTYKRLGMQKSPFHVFSFEI
jgi:L-amino acid N-acyltransferase YncA